MAEHLLGVEGLYTVSTPTYFMARRNNNKMTRGSKLDPSVMELRFSLFNNGEGNIPNYLDINQVLSLVNRRFYRQGLVNTVASIEVQFKPLVAGTPGTGTVVISKLPTTWVFSNAWHKAFAVWQRMNSEALAENDSIKPRFLDFKIFADAKHHNAGVINNMLPLNIDNLPITPGEWEISRISTPVGQLFPGAAIEHNLIGVGANYPGVSPVTLFDAVSLIEGYAASRALPNVLDPNTPDDAADVDGITPANWMAAIFNEGTDQTEDVIDVMIHQNNVAPYPFENGPIVNNPGLFFTDTMYPNGANQFAGLQFHDKLLITTSTIGGSDTAIGGVFPCGLVRFDCDFVGATAECIVRFIPGEHRGYMSGSMQDM